jgi:predicted metal-dependent phosphoesterase TrpH
MGDVTLRAVLGRASVAVFLAAVVAGSLVDDVSPREPVARRGRYLVLETDLHAHTRFADGFLSPFDLVLQAKRRGLDVLAITDHNIAFPAKMGRWFSPIVGGPTILVGEEVTTRTYHLHGIGLHDRVDASLPLADVIDAIHRQGALVIAAHPAGRYRDAFLPELARIDGAEVMHPLAFGTGRPGGWSWESMRDFYAAALASGHRLTAVGSSDYHFFSPLGVCRTLVFADNDGADAVMDALRSGRTVVYDLAGHAYGDPAMVAALEREPYTFRPQDYGYHGSGAVDRVTRLLGWLGMLGLVLFLLARGARAGATRRSPPRDQ